MVLPTAIVHCRVAVCALAWGVSFEQSFRLEPTQVAGVNQAYRSLVPESLVGAQSGELFETLGLSF
jgi:hypothetical protein